MNRETLPPPPLTLPQAIARMEGWYLSDETPSRAQRNLNPGNVNFSPFSEQFGAVLETDTPNPRFARFKTASDGWACLIALLSGPKYIGLTLADAINRYAPPSENNTTNYVTLVGEWTQSTPDTSVRDLMKKVQA